MDYARSAVLAVAGVILVVTVLTGPVGPFAVPDGRFDGAAPGTGNATITDVSVAGQPTLERGRQGTGVYYLRVPDADIEVSEVRGNPSLTYVIEIDELGYSRGTTTFLGGPGPGRHSISLTRDTFEGDRIDRETYRATLELVLRGADTDRIVYSEPTTVEVGE